MNMKPPQRLSLCILIITCFILPGAIPQAVRADEASTAKRFEMAKRDEPGLIAFLKAMPKGADLHNHVSGAIYAETWLDNAVRQGLFFNPATARFEKAEAPGLVPASRLLTDDRLLSQFLDAASMRGWRPGMESSHDHFFNAFGQFGSAGEGLTDADLVTEVARRAQAQNIQYLELMTHVAPDSAYRALLQDLPAVDDPEAALAVLKPRLDAFVAAARPTLDSSDEELARRLGVSSPITGAQGPVTVRYIVSANRLAPDNVLFVTLAAGMALMQQDRRVVGVNIVAPEDHPTARTHFSTQMRLIDSLWKHYGHPNITLHAGELTPAISPVEVMESRIRSSIEQGHARRIGHGVSIAWEDNLPGLLQEMREQGILVEICLTSNAAILGVSGNDHPFNLYRRAGVPVSLNTDDEGVNRSNLTLEFVRAVRTYNLSYPELKTLIRNSLEYSFLPGVSLYLNHDYHRLRPPFTGIERPRWHPASSAQQLMARSDKLKVEVRLEQAFALFEE